MREEGGVSEVRYDGMGQCAKLWVGYCNLFSELTFFFLKPAFMIRRNYLCLGWALVLPWIALLRGAPVNELQIPPSPPLPVIESLVIEPSHLQLQDARDVRRVVVWGITADGKQLDVTSQAQFRTESGVVMIESNEVRPRSVGECEIDVVVQGVEAKLSVSVLNAEGGPVRFVREVLPILSKAGCNAGTCHGAANGKNGFRLSLRGYDPEFDYRSLVTDLAGRRFDRVRVEHSLMLLKPAAQVPHEGGQVLAENSREYDLLRRWIAEGTRFEDASVGRAVRVEVIPSDIALELPGMRQSLIVLAHYPDGTVRDVSREAILSSNNEEVALVKDGVVIALRRGEAAVLVRYEGNYATREVTVMGDRTGFAWKETPENNFIDGHVHAKLRKLKILPSDLCTDAEFIRRVSLDLTGQPPLPERVRSFLTDTTPSKEKRERLIDELLETDEYVQFWANKWADLLQCNSEALGDKGVWVFRQWIKNSIRANAPYDQFVRELLAAQGSAYENPAANYLRVLREPEKITEDVTQTFLGTRFNCNKCHDHPFERWTQDQYYEFGAFFAQVAIKRGALPGEEVVYRNYNGGEVRHPRNFEVVSANVPFGTLKESGENRARREALIQWLTSEENPLFAKSMANRVWSYFFGRGIIDPVDDIRGSNPPSNGPLLDALTEEFVSSGFDVKRLMRTICQSRTYQLSFRANEWNEDDAANFSHALPRRLSAEQLLDAIAIATGHRPRFGGLPVGFRAVEVPDGTVAGNDFLALFGRPKRQSACECERTSKLTLSHAMSLINGSTIGEAVSAPNNAIQKLVESEPDDGRVIEAIYLACLSRYPTDQERRTIELQTGEMRLESAQDLAWALMNSPAFLFNR